jgi:hypothetical protein
MERERKRNLLGREAKGKILEVKGQEALGGGKFALGGEITHLGGKGGNVGVGGQEAPPGCRFIKNRNSTTQNITSFT